MRPSHNYSIITLVVLSVGTLAGGFLGGPIDAAIKMLSVP